MSNTHVSDTLKLILLCSAAALAGCNSSGNTTNGGIAGGGGGAGGNPGGGAGATGTAVSFVDVTNKAVAWRSPVAAKVALTPTQAPSARAPKTNHVFLEAKQTTTANASHTSPTATTAATPMPTSKRDRPATSRRQAPAPAPRSGRDHRQGPSSAGPWRVRQRGRQYCRNRSCQASCKRARFP